MLTHEDTAPMSASIRNRLAENIARVRARIAAAARNAGRSPDDVLLVAVTKYVGPDVIRVLAELGVRDFGESRPQALWDKTAALGDVDARWHLIGHLQRNKVRRTLPLVELLHSLDSPRLADEIEAIAAAMDRRVRALVEVNVSGDATKTGATPELAEAMLRHVANCPHLAVAGLMTMASREGDAAAARAEFDRLRQLRDELAPRVAPHVKLAELSMGMSGDFEQAIAAGATIIRVGSALFEGL